MFPSARKGVPPEISGFLLDILTSPLLEWHKGIPSHITTGLKLDTPFTLFLGRN